MLDRHHAMTASEMEARASDRTWDPMIIGSRIDPHHLTTARDQLLRADRIRLTTGSTRGGHSVITWSRAGRESTRVTIDVAARKRLLTARHTGWATRGGNGIGLIGAAGEAAAQVALHETGAYSNIIRSTVNVLDVDLTALGEVDLSCGYFDASDPAQPVAVTVMIEVKNTRHWHYAQDVDDKNGDIRKFLKKAAHIQLHRPNALICPVVLVRRAQQTLVQLGESDGFLVASTDSQVVLPDHDIDRSPKHFAEVRDELGYGDLRLLRAGQTTRYHSGILGKYVPKRAREFAEMWRQTFPQYIV